MSGASIELKELACLRGGRMLFTGIDLALDAGGAAIVSGPNGSGKTSLLRQIAGLLPVAAGRIERIGGVALAGGRPALDAERPLARALRYWARLDGAGDGEVRTALEAMGLDGLAEVPVRMLSAGQMRRADIARVIAGGAAIWLLDEPASGLDADSRNRLDQAMAAHRSADGIVVAATHQPLGLPGAAAIDLGAAA